MVFILYWCFLCFIDGLNPEQQPRPRCGPDAAAWRRAFWLTPASVIVNVIIFEGVSKGANRMMSSEAEETPPPRCRVSLVWLLHTQISEHGSSEWRHRRTISGSSKNLSNQGSLKNHVLRVLQNPIKVSQRTFNKWYFKTPFLVPQRTFQTRVLQRTISLKSSLNHFIGVSKNLQINGSLVTKNKELSNQGSLKNLFLK